MGSTQGDFVACSDGKRKEKRGFVCFVSEVEKGL
jgi:hypothetical protein